MIGCAHLTTLAIAGTLLTGAAVSEPAQATRHPVGTAYGALPLSFEANRGQVDGQVDFLARGTGYRLFLTPREVVLALREPTIAKEAGNGKTRAGKRSLFRMKLLGADPESQASGQGQLPGLVNYLVGNRPERWRTNIPTYTGVMYRGVYRGIDLLYYGNHQQLEYDFVVAPGADPNIITLGVEDPTRLELDPEGDLVWHTASADIRLRKPVVYQEVDGVRQEVAGSYRLDAQQVRFRVGTYDASRPLVIDPVLVFSTYLGGAGRDSGNGIAVDATGHAYVAGATDSLDFPLGRSTSGGSDAFVAKLSPDGRTLAYVTYLGGIGDDVAHDIALDGNGNAYVTGQTDSFDFPTNPPRSVVPCCPPDAFVAKLDSTGSALEYAMVLGGRHDDVGVAIAVDVAGRAYVTGETDSPDFPTVNPLQATFRGGDPGAPFDAFVAKLNAAGFALVYSTYLGGSGRDEGHGIAVDVRGNAYVTGETSSPDFPTVQPFQPAHGGFGPFRSDAFVAKLDPAGSALVYSTYLGGDGTDIGSAIAVDRSGNAYVTGSTGSTNFPTANPLQARRGGFDDAFVAKLDPAGSALVYSTYLGGDGTDVGSAIAVDRSGNAYVTGATNSTNFPTLHPFKLAFGDEGCFERPRLVSCDDAFVAKLEPAGSALVYSTYLGGKLADGGRGVAVDVAGNAYVTGTTASSDFPTASALQPASGGGGVDVFVVKIADAADLAVTQSASSNPVHVGNRLTYTIAVTNNGPLDATGVTLTDSLPERAVVVSATSTQGGCVETGSGGIRKLSCALGSLGNGASATVSIAVRPTTPATAIANTATVTGDEPDPDPENDTAQLTIVVSPVTAASLPATDLAVVSSVAPTPVLVGQDLTYTVSVTNHGPSAATGLKLTDILGAGVVLISAIPSQGNCHGSATVGCNLGNLGSGARATVTILVRPTAPGTITNTAAVSGAQPDPNTENNVATQDTMANPADLAVTKSSSTLVLLGEDLTYSVVVTNNGPAPATGVLLTDTLPAGATFVSATPTQGSCSGTTTVTCALGSLPAGASATVTIVVTPTAPGKAANTATVTADEPDPNLANNSVGEIVFVNFADLAVTKSAGRGGVLVGEELPYTVVVSNRGLSTATGVMLSDRLPGNVLPTSATSTQGTCTAAAVVTCSLGDLASGASATVTIVVTPSGPGMLANMVTVTGNELDPDRFNNTATTSTRVGIADLMVTKSAFPEPATPGQDVTYTVVVTNNGPSAATGVTLDDQVSSSGLGFGLATPTQGSCRFTFESGRYLCELGGLARGASATVTIVVTPFTPGILSNVASASALEVDPNPGDNAARTLTTVGGVSRADVAVVKFGTPRSLRVGEDLTYTVLVTNNGPADNTGVLLDDQLPETVAFVSAESTQGSCALREGGFGVLRCDLGGLASGARVTVTIVVRPTAAGTIVNEVTASALDDPDLGNNRSAAVTTVE